MIPFPLQHGALGLRPERSISSLLRFEGSNGSTTFGDDNGFKWTANGNAQISTAQFPFGTSSGLFDGTGDYLSSSEAASSWNFATSEQWCVEAYVRPAVNTSIRGIASRRNNTGTQGWVFWIRDTAKLGFVFGNGTAQWVDLSGSTSISTGVWTHVAVSYDGTTLRLFVGGSLDASTTTFSGSRQQASVDALIGRDRDANTTRDFNGYIKNLRVVTRSPVYTSSFTPGDLV